MVTTLGDMVGNKVLLYCKSASEAFRDTVRPRFVTRCGEV